MFKFAVQTAQIQNPKEYKDTKPLFDPLCKWFFCKIKVKLAENPNALLTSNSHAWVNHSASITWKRTAGGNSKTLCVSNRDLGTGTKLGMNSKSKSSSPGHSQVLEQLHVGYNHSSKQIASPVNSIQAPLAKAQQECISTAMQGH